jgi:hypothetical protein
MQKVFAIDVAVGVVEGSSMAIHPDEINLGTNSPGMT